MSGTLGLVLAAIAKGWLILLAALLTVALLRRHAASFRHAAWTVAFVGLLVVFVAPWVLPHWRLPVLPSRGDAEVRRTPVVGAIEPATTAVPRRSAVPHPVPPLREGGSVAAASAGRLLALLRILGGVWAAGALLLLVRVGCESVALHRLRSSGTPPPPGWRSLLESCARRVGLERPPALCFSAGVAVPMVWGLWRPTVLLPEIARRWSRERLVVVLLHEMAHVRRRDPLGAVVVAVARALHWPDPLIWWAAGRAVLDREQACDDLVLRTGEDRLRYAGHLLETARGIAGVAGPAPSLALPEMASPSTLRRRIEALVDAHRSIAGVHSAGSYWVLIAVVCALLFLACAELGDRRTSWRWSSSPEPLEEILEQLAGGAPEERRRAAWKLGEREDSAAGPQLVAALADADAELRGMAAWALGEIKDPATLEPLLEAMADPDPLAREMIVRAVGEIEDPRALPALLEVAGGDSAEVRAAAVRALSDLAESPEARRAVERALDDEVGWVREAAVAALGEMARDEQAAVALLPLLRDGQAAVRAGAARSLGLLGDPRAIDGLVAATRDPEPAVRSMAVWALDEIGAGS